MAKKILLFEIALVLFLSGCGNDNQKNVAENKKEQETMNAVPTPTNTPEYTETYEDVENRIKESVQKGNGIIYDAQGGYYEPENLKKCIVNDMRIYPKFRTTLSFAMSVDFFYEGETTDYFIDTVTKVVLKNEENSIKFDSTRMENILDGEHFMCAILRDSLQPQSELLKDIKIFHKLETMFSAKGNIVFEISYQKHSKRVYTLNEYQKKSFTKLLNYYGQFISYLEAIDYFD